jgi:hypothetical protein
VGSRLARWRLERELRGEKRAGAYARRRARELQYSFVKRNRAFWLLLAAWMAAGAPIAALFPDEQGAFFLGVWLTALVALGLHLTVVMSGSANWLAGHEAEQWTRRELAKLRSRGWTVVHGVPIPGKGDADHVAIGPGGLVVLETKWSAEDWRGTRRQPWIRDAADQVERNAEILRGIVSRFVERSAVRRVVVLWPSSSAAPVQELNGVNVVQGLQLREWFDDQGGDVLDARQIAGAWQRLVEEVGRLDQRELAVHGRPPRSVLESTVYLAEVPFGILIGLMVGSLFSGSFDWRLALTLDAIVTGLSLVARRRARRLQRLLTGIAVGTTLVIAAFAVLVVYFTVT